MAMSLASVERMRGKTRCREFEVGGVGEGSFCIVEGCGLRRALGFPAKVVQRGAMVEAM